MPKWIETTAAIVQLLPSLLTLIVQIEQIIGAGKGDAKKALIMDQLPADQRAQALVSCMVDKSVTGLNRVGALSKKTVPAVENVVAALVMPPNA